ADHRHVQVVVLHQRLQCWIQHLGGQVAGGAEQHHRVGRLSHVHPGPPAGLAAWPPNSLRMAERMRLARSFSPRELKRAASAAPSTGAGTEVSMAACRVQRPSPESATWVRNSPSLASASNAWAVRSSSQERITLPRRHTSATSARSKSYW